MRVCLLLALSGFLAAQTPEKYPLETFRVEGNRRIDSQRILAASGLKIGASVQKADFDAARERLLESGAFESVGYSYKPSASNKGFDAAFQVVEVSMLYPYRFEELPGSGAALRAALHKQEPLLDDRIPATPQVLNRYTAAIHQFFDGKVEAKAEVTADSGTLEIVFRPPGERARISEVSFTGSRAIAAEVLAGKLATAAVGIAYSESLFRRVLDSAIRPLYEELGYVRVTFPEITVKKAENNEGVAVTIAVSEGQQYKLGTVQLAGLGADEIDSLDKATDWHKGETVNFANVEAALEKIRQRQRVLGYLRAATQVDRDIRDQDHTVNLTVHIDRGPQFTLGKLSIQGLDLISEPAVRKMWKIDPGKPFEDGYPEAFLARLRADGVFDNLGKTSAQSDIHEDSHTVDVTLIFSGARVPAKDAAKDPGRIGR